MTVLKQEFVRDLASGSVRDLASGSVRDLVHPLRLPGKASADIDSEDEKRTWTDIK